MDKFAVVTGKVPKELKEKAKRLGININRVIREALEEAIRKREEELARESIRVCSDILAKVDMDRVIKSIREDRESR